MRLKTAAASSLSASTPLVAVLVADDRPDRVPGGPLGARAAALMRREVFEGKPRETLVLHDEDERGPRSLLLVGMGPAGDATTEDARRAGAIVVNEATRLGARKVVVGAAGAYASGRTAVPADHVQPLGEGAVLAGYRYSGAPKHKRERKPPNEVAIVGSGSRAKTSLTTAAALGDAQNLAREVGDSPSNVATPKHLTKVAKDLCRAGGLRCRVYGEKDLERMKYGAILGVGQGSEQESFLIEMEYRPAKPKATVCVVGKGLTFDTGGISIKPAQKMEDMKYDMCGAAAVLGLMQAVGALKPKGVRVIGLVGTAENMPDGRSYKPGDVVRSGSGQTIEVINTDAEGRVVLADALHHATTRKPDAIIDLATLTGAIVVALGHEAAGVFCKDDVLARRLLDAAARTDERCWRMPTYDEYAEKLESPYADVRNVTNSRDAGSCSAAQFLFRFSKDVPHAHLDIAGVANDTRARDYHTGGGVGFGVRLVYDAIAHW